MLLSPDDAGLFLSLYMSLIGYVSGRLGRVGPVKSLKTFCSASWEGKAKARDKMLDNIHLLDDFTSDNPQRFTEDELALVRPWKGFLRGNFIIERDLKRYTVFLDADSPDRAYGVLGLTTEIVEMLPDEPPMMATAVLLPWRDKIVCDGLIRFFNVVMGTNMRRCQESYRQVKERGIVTSLDPDSSPIVQTEGTVRRSAQQ
jgi:hypothetical protein